MSSSRSSERDARYMRSAGRTFHLPSVILVVLVVCAACGGSELTADASITRDAETFDAPSSSDVGIDAELIDADDDAETNADSGTLDPDSGHDGGTPESTEAGPWTPPPRSPRIPEGDRFASNTFTLGGQTAVFHDEGHSGGVFHTYDAFSACGEPRRVHVFLPRDYAERTERLPVVYFNDGNTTFWPGGVSPDAWEAARAVSDLRAAERLEPVVLVAIHPRERDREYTHVEWLSGRSCCGVSDYAESLATCFKPFFDTHYRTTPTRAAIVGSSHGGLAAFFTITRHPESFSFGAALSPSFWVGLDSRTDGASGEGSLEESALVMPVRSLLSGPSRPRLWIDWGLVRTGGVHNAVIERLATERGREMVELLERSGYDATTLTWLEEPEGAHDEASWARRLPQVLERFAGR